MLKFNFYHIRFTRGKSEKHLVISGEVENLSGKDFNSVAIRLIIFGGNKSMLNTVIILRGVNHGQIRAFYKQVDVGNVNELLEKITRHEMLVEGAY